MADTSIQDLHRHSSALFHHLRDTVDVVFSDILEAHLPALADALLGLRSEGYPIAGDSRSSYAFYALSRVIDQVACGERTGRLPEGSLQEFWDAIGATPFETPERSLQRGRGSAYSPLHHEITEVISVPDGARATVAKVILPGAMFGSLLLARAWVAVDAPPSLIPPELPLRVLYFAHQRPGRRAHDLSHGWGHNSQWNTDFHRFYDTGTTLVFNANAANDLASWPTTGNGDDVGPAGPTEYGARIDALVHRTNAAGFDDGVTGDLWPYDDTLTVRADSTWPYTQGDFVDAHHPDRFGRRPRMKLVSDSFALLWTSPQPTAMGVTEVSEPLDDSGFDIDPDLRVRLEAAFTAVNAATNEVVVHKSAVAWDDHVIRVELAGLEADLARRGQPAGWEVSAPSADWVPPTSDRSTIPPCADAADRFGVSILRELGIRHGSGGNSAVRAWGSPDADAHVVELVAAVLGPDPTFQDRRSSTWWTEERVEFFARGGPVESPLTRASRPLAGTPDSVVFLTTWVAVRDASYATEWGVFDSRSTKTVLEVGRVVLPAPIPFPPAIPLPRPATQWFGRVRRRLSRGKRHRART